ncbi:MAG: tetratricopeptide repeat protein, partial [Gammaproteobacteria bacterium]|nr:tetratricopeptide repeat protein [Gammaproteobacteria bacterium]
MKILHSIIIAGFIMTMFACSSGGRQDMATLESLENRKIKVNPQELPTASKVDAKKRYQEFAKSTDNQELRAVAMERLADIELENKQNEKFREAELKEAEQRARLGSDTAVVDTSKLGDYSSVAQQYEKLLKRYPDSKDNEKILYQLARAYDLSAQPEQSLKVLTRLMKEFPENKHAEEVQFRRGEIYFSLSDFKNAEHAYGYVLSNRDSPFYERSLYKHGWALFKLNRLEQSRYSFYKLLDLYFSSGRNYENFKRSEKELIDDTMRVVGLTYSFEGGVNTLKQFSRQYGARNYESLIYKELGNQYLRQERIEDAANVFANYAEVYPNSREAPLFLVEVIKIYEKGGFPQKLSAAKGDLVTRYAISKPFWSRHDRQLLEEVSPYIKNNLDELARHHHAQAQKSKKASDYKVAAHWYREYVTSFPSDEKAPQMNFLLAENLMETKEYLAAATEYERTAYSYAPHKQSAEAGYAALLAHQTILGTLKGDQRTAKRHEIVDSALKFAQSFPKDKRTATVMLKAAEELLDLKRVGEASTVARQVLELEKNKKKADQQLVASA